MKWNNSMPRYAANLSLDPIQPQTLQQIQANTSGASNSNNHTTVSKSIPKKDVAEVPAAQFDWSGAGLVNPLAGK